MNKRIFLLLGTIALATTYFVYQVATTEDVGSKSSSVANSSEEEQIATKSTMENSQRIEPVLANNMDITDKSIQEPSNEYDYLKTLDKVSELQKQLIKLGYFIPPEYVASYASYTEDSLLQMTEYGDMVAIKTLQNRYAQAGQWDALRNMQEVAVQHGSVSDISDLHDTEFAKYSGEETRDSLLKSAAYAELAAMRGSNVTVYYAINNFNENGVEFSQSELTKINQMAKDMLNKINAARQSKGMTALKKIDDSQLVNNEPTNSLSGWGSGFVINR